jgi:transcriptional regulator with XRE-family HTH domain
VVGNSGFFPYQPLLDRRLPAAYTENQQRRSLLEEKKMFNNEKVGKRIAVLRKEHGLTQEQLAERLDVTGQAVSKWEKGGALPDISLLPVLGRLFDVSIDQLLAPFDVFVIEARYGADGYWTDVSARLNALVGPEGVYTPVNSAALGADPAPGRIKFLWVRYINREGAWAAFAAQGGMLNLSNEGRGLPPQSGDALAVLSAQYGSEEIYRDATAELIKYLQTFGMEQIPAAHEWFPSPAALDGPAHLSVLYRSGSAFQTLCVPEGRALIMAEDRRTLSSGVIRMREERAVEKRLGGVENLAFGRGIDCSFAGAVSAALKAMGEKIDYTDVMGFSGCCWRLALCSPGWDPSSVDGLVVYDHAAPLWDALGYAMNFFDRVEPDERAKVRGFISASIDRGLPVLAIDLRIAAEWGVICGYRDGGKTFLCRTYFDEGAVDYLEVERWPFLIVLFNEKKARPSALQSLLRSLAIFVDEMNIPERRGYSMGYHAYRTWAADLRDQARWQNEPDELFSRAMMVNHFVYLALVDARRSGAEYLRRCREQGLLDGEKADALARAAELYAQIDAELEAGWIHVPHPELAQQALRAEWTEAKREAQAALLDKAVGLERQAQTEFEKIL